MEIRSLRYVVTLAEELHFGRAARRHYIAAQPFGRHIQRVEREVGRRLFERTSRRVALTPAGERLVAEARKVLAAVDGLAEVAREDAPYDGAPIRVGVLGFGLAEAWPALVEVAAGQVPGLVLDHRELDLASQYDAVRLGRVDVGVVQYVGPVDGLVFDRVVSVPRVAVVPARSPYADAERLTGTDVADAAWIGMSAGHPALLEWAGTAAQWSRDPVNVRVPAAIPTAVAITGRLGLHAEAARRFYPHPGVRFVPMEGPACEAAIATRARDDRPGVAAFRRAARLLADHNFSG
ncbi:LysR family transcriptional regulator [Nonomuraea rhizosphaerae]|uniref:LysR family transcriptional regulator n=1 Tax=Nonomuraea rhizosphaerae TaxID=2665663 RepID=UPI001C5E1265|nr:LysR family transcriptional regulator [Nonomuraea rhizosphaerae]